MSQEESKKKGVQEWSVEQVCEWLKRIGMEKYEGVFRSNDIDGYSLLELAENHIEKMEIKAVGHRVRIMKQIEELKRASDRKGDEASLDQVQVSPIDNQARLAHQSHASASPAPSSGPSAPAALRVMAVKKIEFGHVSSQTCRAIGSQGSNPGQLNYPFGILMDESTNHLIVSELGNHRVQEMDENGRHVRFFGNGRGNQPGQLHGPWGMTMSQEGRLIVCDRGNNRLQWWRKEDASHAGLFAVDPRPRCVAIGPSGDQLFVSLGSNKIGVISMDGQPIGSMGNGEGSMNGQLNFPIGVAFNSHGDLVVGDSMNKRICVFEVRSGQCIATFSDRRFGGGWLHVAVDSFDRIIVSASGSHPLTFIDGGFESIGEFGSKGNQLGQFSYPQGVCIDEKNGRLLVCDMDNNRVQILNG